MSDPVAAERQRILDEIEALIRDWSYPQSEVAERTEVYSGGERVVEVPRADLYDENGKLMEDAAEGYAEAEANNMVSYGRRGCADPEACARANDEDDRPDGRARRRPQEAAAVERLCEAAWSAVATLREEGYERAADDLVEAVAAVRGREEREGG